ncbi:uncharacterized protein [Antedon mediterranea]|uniref:uncharacterized protein n=1 Tax=Antedon mediterranea TaxID=105859 RepID=UPI003AF7B8E2
MHCQQNLSFWFLFVAWTKDSEVFSARHHIDKVALENINGEDPEDRYWIIKIYQGDVGKYNLVIDSIKGVDSGNYQCAICQHSSTSYVCTAITDFKSTVATLNVLYTPSVPEYPECTGLDSSATVSVGTQVEVTCVSEIGDPKVHLQWNKDGVPLSSTVTEREDNNILYLIYTFIAELSHTGMVLSCSSTSSHFTSYSESCNFNALNVVDMPVVAVTSGAAVYEEGSPANFTCSAFSSTSTAITFEWFVGNIPKSRYTQNDTRMESVLTITSVIASDHQTAIKCVVRNEQGQTAQDQVFLEVISRPTNMIPTSRIDEQPQLTITRVPDDGNESCSVAIGGTVVVYSIVLLIVFPFL